MSGYLSIPLFAVAVIVQSSILSQLRIGGGQPDLVLVLVLSWALMAGFERGVVWAIVGGVTHDLVSDIPIGTTSLALVIVVALAVAVMGQVNPRNLLYPTVAAGPATLVAHLVVLVVLTLVGRPLPIGEMLGYATLPAMVYNIVMIPVIYRILGSIYGASRPRRIVGFE